ncbi:MAG: hypothetical protein J6Y05_00660, partial [Bacteroidales bacterium]|nr:hypothetical protein [Bacteroidales bacterium]
PSSLHRFRRSQVWLPSPFSAPHVSVSSRVWLPSVSSQPSMAAFSLFSAPVSPSQPSLAAKRPSRSHLWLPQHLIVHLDRLPYL